MKKNAFTLIELLAVIVILAIIALIAVPIVISIINDSKKSSEERTIDLYLDSVENVIATENLKRKYMPNVCEIQIDGNVKCDGNIDNYNEDEELSISLKGEKPSSGTIILEDGKITDIFDLVLNGKKYDYEISKTSKLLEIPETAGLYDENYNLLATWDELVSYGLDVSNYHPSSNSVGSLNYIILNNPRLKAAKLLIISSSVTSIGGNTFSECTSLTSIVIPSSVINMYDNPFSGCNNLKKIRVDLENPVYKDANSNAIIEKTTNKLIVGCKSTIIPSSVTSIGTSAFSGSGITSITIPSSVSSIGGSAFSRCKNLKSINIPSSIQGLGFLNSHGNGIFAGCSSLENITIPSSVTFIGDCTFQDCINLKRIIIPDSVTSIGSSAFAGCSSLKSITIPESVTSIEDWSFSRCTNLTSVTIPSSVTIISYNAFKNCTSLTNVTFENTSNWKVNGETIDVSNSETNAINLVSTYVDKYWEKN